MEHSLNLNRDNISCWLQLASQIIFAAHGVISKLEFITKIIRKVFESLTSFIPRLNGLTKKMWLCFDHRRI